MKLKLYQVDAFANKVFEGNPAAICPLEKWLDDNLMQAIAAENNLSETAFYVPNGTGYHIRWFTPLHEVDLCGHATLAAAHIIFNEQQSPHETIYFSSKSGELSVSKNTDRLELNFPAQPPEICDTPRAILEALNITPLECLKSQDYIVILDSEESVINAKPNMQLLTDLALRGVAITAKATEDERELDFVTRFFAPKYGVNEDPVTGSAFTQLMPYWSARLNKTTMKARQLSCRAGDVVCVLDGDRVRIAGSAVTYMSAVIEV